MARPKSNRAIADIAEPEPLLRYAIDSQIFRFNALHGGTMSDAKIADAIGVTSSKLSRAKSDTAGGQKLGEEEIKRLDRIFVSRGLAGAGGLGALAIRLRGGRHDWEHLGAAPPARWADLLSEPSSVEHVVLEQAEALLAMLTAADRIGLPVNAAHKTEIEHVVKRLILIGAAPPTSRNVEALVVLGNLAGLAFPEMQDSLREALSQPLGFRVWRALTKSVLMTTNAEGRNRSVDSRSAGLRDCVRDLLDKAEDMRVHSLYPARSLDLELAITVPEAWSRAGDDWAAAALRARVINPQATLRERGTAAFGLWQRAIGAKGEVRAQMETDLRALIAQLQEGEFRPDVANGNRWLALTLTQAIDQNTAVCTTWPVIEDPWFQAVIDAGRRLDVRETIPPQLRSVTRTLFEHTLLQNAGVIRRKAIDTLIAAGWAREVTSAVIEVLNKVPDEPWLRIRALFALGFLQHRDSDVERALAVACDTACRRLQQEGATPAMATEMHAVLFAIGDLFGVKGAEDRARSIRTRISRVLKLAAEPGTDPQVARAAAYMLTVTAQSREDDGRKDLSQELLESLARHPDPVTRELSLWTLSFRFAPDYSIRPLLDQARGPLPGPSDLFLDGG